MRTNMKRSNGMADQKSHKLRMDGMAMALRIVEEYGVEGLREEVKTRKAMFIPLEVTRKSVEDLNDFLGKRILNTYRTEMLFTLNQEFGFGPKRLLKFYEKFGNTVDMVLCLDQFGKPYEKISEHAEIVNQKIGKDILDVDEIRKIEEENAEGKKRLIEYEYLLDFLHRKGFDDAAACLKEAAEWEG